MILLWLSYPTFLIWPLFRGYGRNPYRNFVGFLVDLKTPKGHFEINWPLLIKSMQLKSSKVPLPYVEEQVWGHENVMTASVVPSSQKQNKIISSKSFTKISQMSAQIELEKCLISLLRSNFALFFWCQLP